MRYAIYEGNWERMLKKVQQVRNKCGKYGCDFHFEEVGEEYREVKGEDGEKFTAKFILVDAEGEAIINGWKFIGTVEHTEKGNIISKACDVEVPERYYDSKPVCEHCHTDRYRKFTYIVQNTETGEFKQVGKACLKDFTQGMSVDAISKYEWIFDELEQAGSPMGGGEHYLDTIEFLKVAAETVRHFGYVKVDYDSDYETEKVYPTKVRALDYYRAINGMMFRECLEETRKEMAEAGFDQNSEETAETVKAALAWLKDQPEENNYIHNLKTACECEYNRYKNAGILASLFPTYYREMHKAEKKAERVKAESKSEYVGQEGQRIDIEVKTVTCLTSWESMYGMVRLYKIEGQDGNIYTWKTGSYVEENVKSMKGTVKGHTDYNGVKQTELTRCKVTA